MPGRSCFRRTAHRCNALDARDGHLIGRTNDLGDHPDQHNAGRSPLGGMTLAGGRLWLQCMGSAATALDLKNRHASARASTL